MAKAMQKCFTWNIQMLVFVLCFVISPFGESKAQADGTRVVISQFEITGNKRTKESTIIRELDFQVGDTIAMPDLSPRLGKNITLLMNTNLFYEVDMNIKDWDTETGEISILIELREAWYIYPVPIFELADRNFNVWWRDHKRSFKRVNYGLRVYHANISGRRDQLKAVFQLGYTQKFELQYTLPYLNKAQTLGMTTNFLFSRNKEVGARTFDNDVEFYRDDERFMLRRYRYGFGLNYRPGLYQQHQVEATYYHRIIADTVSVMNPDFFLEGDTRQRFFSLGYTYRWDRRDLKAYPVTGHYIVADLEKEGLGFFQDRNALYLTATYAQYLQLGKRKKYSLALIAKGRAQALRQQPPYYNNQALGYFNDYLRGYEFYVMDGLDYAYLKTSLRYELLNRKVNWKKAMPLEAFRIMPLRLYLTTNWDMGYANDPFYQENNPLSNDFLYGGGVGLDLIIYVDKVIQVEYSVNKLGEKGVYLHYSLFF